MDKNAVWKWLVLIGLLSFSGWIVTPFGEKIQLGLDLKGGTSFVVKIDEEQISRDVAAESPELSPEEVTKEVGDILDGAQDRALEVLRNRIDSLGIAEPIIYPGKDNRIVIQLPGIDEEKRKEAEENILSAAFMEFRMVHDENDALVRELFEKDLAPPGYQIVSIAGKPIYRRDKRAVGDEEMDRAFRERLGRFQVPSPAYEFMLQKTVVDKDTRYRPAFVKRRRELTGEYLKNAAVDFQSLGQPIVKIEFDSKGTRKFANLTRDHAPGGPKNPNPENMRYLAIVLDGTLYSSPYIREPIFGGKAEISGSFDVVEANFLRNILNAGSLPAPVRIVEKRFVSPSLGKDSIDSGVRAVTVAAVAVVLFMGVYYLLGGLVANIALILNMLLLPVGMILAAGFLGIFASEGTSGGPIKLPVLTLPGIAGILLTIGMAVDANVLIFERIREESKVGKRLWTSITAGYDRAFVTILDANVTTFLTGVILFIFGSGPIRGFAVTLCAGIMVSMYTALVVTRMIFALIAGNTKLKNLKMLSVIRDTAIDFIGRRKFACAISVVVIVVTWAFMSMRGVQNPASVFSVDFTGGSSVTFEFQEKQSVEDLRSELEDAGLQGVHIQYQQEMEAGGTEYLQIKTGNEEIGGLRAVEVVKAKLAEAFPAAGFVVTQEDEVGPQVGAELKRRAMLSIGLALLVIIIYISWRFELGFAVGAIVALLHDVLVTVGIFTLLGRQLSLPVIAALMTIVGYSVNDTIVVFDRIREDLRLVRNRPFKDICNLSINQTLSRTVLTSLTTLLAVTTLLVLGGGAVNDFALALFIGVLVGTYSSIFVATPVVLLWHRDRLPQFATSSK
ncbi:MAG: protein translocase subunit SecD [Lentisphaerae bacterium]|nr:protein translocase subunit SecD [Lentisphaerota bacterium]